MTSLPTKDALLDALGGSLEPWACRCHEASLHLVKSGVFGDRPARVARGACMGVPGQHSWVVVGRDPYFLGALIVDPTLWSYDKSVEGIWTGKLRDGLHFPHGMGNIFQHGSPPPKPTGPVIELTPARPLSQSARLFLSMIGPLDYRGWSHIAHGPVQGFPAGEIFEAMQNTPGLKAIVPIDRIGMLTDLNPGGLYLP